jgi:L-alanine-DL-glutamate epimerase-like enolase superfamily enzyme
MKAIISQYELWKLQLPAGRTIGDCTCHYDALDVLAIGIRTNQGHVGWGFGETVSEGVFTRPAPWITPMPSLDEIRRNFERDVWPNLQGRNPFQTRLCRPRLFSEQSYLHAAVRIGIWDLMAKIVELPLYQFLGARPEQNRVRGYGSGLDFPLPEEAAVEIFKNFVRRGFTAVKVKVGHPDPNRDLRRLHSVREVVGSGVEIAIDANEAWNYEQALERIRFFQREGLSLSYVEDPLPRSDLEGLARLNSTVGMDVAGHDYILDKDEIRRFVARKAFARLRVGGEIDQALDCADVSEAYDIPLIFGNSLFELNVHAAVALPRVDRIEFSGLAWNLLPENPVQFEGGYAIAPSRCGHGLDPHPEKLKTYSKPRASMNPRFG